MASKKYQPPPGRGSDDDDDAEHPEAGSSELVRRLTREAMEEEIVRGRSRGRPAIAQGTHPSDPPGEDASDAISAEAPGEPPVLRIYEEQSE